MMPTIGHAQSTAEDKLPADAAPPPKITVSGSATIASDYRFRAVSQSDQEALGRRYNSGAAVAAGVYDRPGAKDDNLHLWGDGARTIATTPLAAKAHVGRSCGQNGLGADATWRDLNFNVSDVDGDISNREAGYLRPIFSKGQDGTGNVAGSDVVVSLTAAF